jgi:hypothetical protein
MQRRANDVRSLGGVTLALLEAPRSGRRTAVT